MGENEGKDIFKIRDSLESSSIKQEATEEKLKGQLNNALSAEDPATDGTVNNDNVGSNNTKPIDSDSNSDKSDSNEKEKEEDSLLMKFIKFVIKLLEILIFGVSKENGGKQIGDFIESMAKNPKIIEHLREFFKKVDLGKEGNEFLEKFLKDGTSDKNRDEKAESIQELIKKNEKIIETLKKKINENGGIENFVKNNALNKVSISSGLNIKKLETSIINSNKMNKDFNTKLQQPIAQKQDKLV